MAALNQLGPYRFLTFKGFPPEYLQQIELVQRPGVEGVALWKTGWRGRPMSLQMTTDSRDYATAIADSVTLLQLTDQPPQQLVYNDVYMLNFNLLFQVLDFKVQRCRGIRTAVGGLYPPSLAFLEGTFTLLPVLNS